MTIYTSTRYMIKSHDFDIILKLSLIYARKSICRQIPKSGVTCSEEITKHTVCLLKKYYLGMYVSLFNTETKF